ncbi:MAG: hypothetical protein FWC00_02525 [Firmicutes bacterium]|nr:hypothetical protein [Bacillota bacterium]
MFDFSTKKYNDFDYKKLVWIQDKLDSAEEITEADSTELMRWIDARIIHNLLIKEYFDGNAEEINLRTDKLGEEYTDYYMGLTGAYRMMPYCVEARRFAKGLCGALGLPAEFYWTGEHAYSTAEVGKRRYIIDPTIGQFYKGMPKVISANKFLEDIIWNGFVLETEESKKQHVLALSCGHYFLRKSVPPDGIHNSRTPREILSLRTKNVLETTPSII